MKAILSNLEGMTSIYMNAHPGVHTAESIRTIINQLLEMPIFAGQVTAAEAEELARLIEEKHGISMGLGAIVDASEFRPWLHDARIEGRVSDFYWSRYRKLLHKKGLPSAVINATDEVTDKVLDRLGDPANQNPWSRRGMVVGHVQSGKTANYTGLICKAADAGYRLIIVIAGIHNNLRNQTQARIDEGFIGRDTGRLAHANRAKRQKIIGVGQFDQREFPVSLTNTFSDFDKATATTNTSQIEQYKVPVVLVIKKNWSTLKHLVEWLREHSVHEGTKMVSQPMLLIDDEADNASINTAYSRQDVSRINEQIRMLLSLFQRSCYVGYTATPFANIFIDPDTDDEVLHHDLFPRHFIIGLDAPTNYFGAQRIFIDEPEKYVRLIEDNKERLPLRHRLDFVIDELPESLIRAVRAFIVARAIRNLRGQKSQHASMLVNASRFTAVQGRLRTKITDIVDRIRNAVAVDGGKGKAALRNQEIAALNEVWKQEFSEVDDSGWEAVQGRLHEVVIALRVIEVNRSRRAEALDYDRGDEHGLTVIAIGGFSLSRGLTLEGLTTSYFLRNSMMYDTLMQMGRWFGYRQGYEDLCRIWMLPDAVGWYSHIHQAMDDLQAQLKNMELAKATPEQFGLAVRSHPESLMVTARNKLGSGQEIPVKVGLAGKMIETTRIPTDEGLLARNRSAADSLARAILERHIQAEHHSRGTHFKAVPVELVIDFLRSFRADPANPLTDPTLVTAYINARASVELQNWDVLFASAQGQTETAFDQLGSIKMRSFERTVGEQDLQRGIFAISGSNRRVGSPGDERVGLTKAQIETATQAFREMCDRNGIKAPKTLPPRIFFSVPGRNPLLILRFVTPKQGQLQQPLVAWSICFPESQIAGGTVDYVVNTVRLREIYGEEEVDQEEEEARVDAG